MITQTINLNLIPGGVLPRINVSQYDKGARTLQFNLYNGVTPFTIPDGSSVYVVGTKADRTGFDYAATYTGGLVSIDVTEQMTAFAGDVEIEIRIIKSGEQIATGNFILCVERTALADDTVISETDIPIIQHLPELVAETAENAELAHKWATFGDESEEPSATNNAKYWAEQAEAAQDLTYTTVNGNPVSFTTNSSGISKDTVVTLEPIQSGSGEPSPTNVRPISGYTEIEVNGCGVNVWDEKTEIGVLNVNGVIDTTYQTRLSSSFVAVEPNTTYFVSDPVINGRYAYYDQNKNLIEYNADGFSSNIITTPNNAYYLRFTVRVTYGTTYNHDISINYPSTDTSYHAYTGHRITSPLPSTIYGGTYDVETGELTVNYALLDLGNTSWSYSSAGFGTSAIYQRVKKPRDNYTVCNAICEQYKMTTYMAILGDVNNVLAISDSGTIFVKDSRYTDPAAFKTAMSGVKLAYELATPYTIQLEPHLLNLFEGQNNVSTNGTQISVAYRNGIVARVDDFNAVGESFEALTGKVEAVETSKAESSALAPVENGATASQPYAVGDYIYRNGTLYRVTSAIASGATFTVDTNITATTVMAEIVRLTQ